MGGTDFFSGLVRGLGGSVGDMYKRQQEKEYRDKMFTLESLMTVSRDPYMRGRYKREILTSLLGPKHAPEIEKWIPDYEVSTGRTMNGQVEETDTPAPQVDPSQLVLNRADIPQGAGPMVTENMGIPPSFGVEPQGAQRRRILGQAKYNEGRPSNTPMKSPDSTSYGQDLSQAPPEIQQMLGLGQPPSAPGVMGQAESAAPVTQAMTGGSAVNVTPAEQGVEEMRKILRIMPKRPQVMSSLDMSNQDIDMAAQRQTSNEAAQREVQNRIALMRAERDMTREERINAGWRPVGGVRRENGKSVQLERNEVTGLERKTEVPGVDESLANSKDMTDYTAQKQAMQPLLTEAFQLMHSSGGKLGLTEALRMAGDHQQAQGIMQDALSDAQLEAAKAAIYDKMHKGELDSNDLRIMRQSEVSAIRQEITQIRGAKAGLLRARAAMGLDKKVLLTPEQKAAQATQDAELEAQIQGLWERAQELAANYPGVQVTRGPDGLPSITAAPIQSNPYSQSSQPKGKRTTMAVAMQVAGTNDPAVARRFARQYGYTITDDTPDQTDITKAKPSH